MRKTDGRKTEKKIQPIKSALGTAMRAGRKPDQTGNSDKNFCCHGDRNKVGNRSRENWKLIGILLDLS